ncbi:transcriptional regulator [Planococcus sp. N028]|uniref:Transcriptional regulator n=1 Tax=Planococcus shixiaomingii TaxID=3058393 RepID=A0ABT8N5P8_9BACL|nr:transcriptional regulator [Planococcus sp. N028]MDN7243211.1 transcriptional regulator [Planococcus sp. N028]
MKAQILKAFKHQQLIEMMYMANDGSISKRRIKILKVSGDTFQAYCFLRNEKRTFKVENVLSLIPVIRKERLII